MDDFEKELRLKRLLIIVVSVVTVILVFVCVGLALSRGNGDPQQPTEPTVTTSPAGNSANKPSDNPGEAMKELLLQDVSEQGNMIVLTTTYCTVSYPVGFEQVVTAEVQNQDNTAKIVVYATIEGKQYAVYALVFNSREGMPIGYLRVEEDIYSVNAIFYDPEGVGEAGKSTFYAAQETFNDVAMSLEENKGFLTNEP